MATPTWAQGLPAEASWMTANYQGTLPDKRWIDLAKQEFAAGRLKPNTQLQMRSTSGDDSMIDLPVMVDESGRVYTQQARSTPRETQAWQKIDATTGEPLGPAMEKRFNATAGGQGEGVSFQGQMKDVPYYDPISDGYYPTTIHTSSGPGGALLGVLAGPLGGMLGGALGGVAGAGADTIGSGLSMAGGEVAAGAGSGLGIGAGAGAAAGGAATGFMAQVEQALGLNPGTLSAASGASTMAQGAQGALSGNGGGADLSFYDNPYSDIGDVTAPKPTISIPGVGDVYGTNLQALATVAQKLGVNPVSVASAIKKMQSGSGDAGLNDLLKLGIPAALIAGLFENNKSPLTGNVRAASDGALAEAAKFAGLPTIQLNDTQKGAIQLAKDNVGNYQPYIDKAGALTDAGTAGVTSAARDSYFNPYVEDVLSPALRDIQEATEKRRQALKAVTSMSGNDLRTPGMDPNRFNIEDSLLDREMLRAVGDTSAKVRSGAWDTANTAAGRDLDRDLSGANLYGGMGKTVGALGATDVASLTSAGALQNAPLLDERQHTADAAKIYAGSAPGAAAISSTTPSSILSQGVGALGAMKTAKDIGIFD